MLIDDLLPLNLILMLKRADRSQVDGQVILDEGLDGFMIEIFFSFGRFRIKDQINGLSDICNVFLVGCEDSFFNIRPIFECNRLARYLKVHSLRYCLENCLKMFTQRAIMSLAKNVNVGLKNV